MKLKTEISINAAKAYGEKYDESAKQLFLNPEIIAPIIQMSVPEYKKYSVEQVIGMIDRSSIESTPVDSASAMADRLPTEMNSIGEKLIRYDSHFKAINPALSDKNIKFYLHIDLEVQNDYRPSSPKYPIVKRGIYYGAREISSQLGVITEENDYSKLEKVYSIWICNENVPPRLRNTVTSYTITKKDEIGITDEPVSDYDLMSVIIIRRGEEASEGIFDYLEGIFKSNIDRIEKYVDIKDKESIKEGVKRMTGLGESIYIKAYKEGEETGRAQGISQGIFQGEASAMFKLVQKGMLTIEEGASELGMTPEEFKESMMKAGFKVPETV